MQSLIDLFGLKDLIPHGYCLSWSPVLLWLNVVSDLLITLSYYSIPLMLVYFIRRRKDLPYPGLAVMFACFIVACGTTHLLSAITIWIPLYWLDGWLKGFTAIISVATAVLMLRVIPGALSVPSAAQLQAEIQQRKTAEHALRESENKLATILDSVEAFIYIKDCNYQYQYANQPVQQVFGKALEDIIGKSDDAFFDEATTAKLRENDRRVLGLGERTAAENIYIHKDSAIARTYFTVKQPLRREDGSIYGLCGISTDITERKQMEEARKEALSRLQKIAGRVPGVVYQYRLRPDGSSCFPFASEAIHDIYRVSPEDVREDGAKVLAILHPDDYDGIGASIQQSAQNLTPWRHEYRVKFDDGTVRWLLGNALPEREADGSTLWHGFITDITERKQMEVKLRDSDAFNVSVINSLTSHIAVLDAQGVIVAANNAWRQFAQENGLLKSSQGMLGFNYLDACNNAFNQPYGDEASTVREGITAVLDGEREMFHLEYLCHSPNQQHWFYMNVLPLQGSCRGVVVSHKNITERKKAEEVALAASQYARSLIEASLDPLVTISAEGKITDVNTATEQVTGAGRDNLIGSDFADYFTDPDKAREGYQRVFSQDFVFDYPLTIRHASGKVTDVLYNASVYRDGNGNVLGVFAAARDVTERKKMEEVTQAAYQYSCSLIEASLDPLVTISAEGKITDVNIATEKVTGVDRDNLIGSDFADYFTDPDKARDGYLQVFSQGFVTDYPLAIRHASGKVTDVLYNGSVYRDGNGNVLGVFAAARDITERREREHQLGLFHSLFEITSDCVFMISPKQDFRFVFVNDAACRHYGVEREQLLKWRIPDWDLNFKNQVDLDALWEGVKARKGFLIETRHRVASGREVPVEVSVNYLLYKDEEYLAGYFHDITDRKLMEDELKASEAKFRSIIEVSPVPMALNDERLNITFLNPAFVQTFGYTTDDIPTVADWWLKAYPDPDYRHWAESTWQTTLEKAKQEQTGFSPMEVAVRCKNNSVKIVLVTAAEVIHNDVAGMHLVVLYDITERKQIEAELTRSNAELEQFAYAVSHDMRQPLRMVTSYLSLIENALTGQLNEETQQFIDFAVNGAKRMDAMILSLLEYSRVGRVFEAKTRLSSQASLDEALAFLNPELSACGGAIKVTGDWPELFASRDELTRLLQNLIGNALKYHDENQPPQVDVHGTISAGSLRVEVRDQGIGIEPSQRDRLFKVFSRLQARSRFDGTGVGLALCRKIVEHHGGTIGVESAGEGQGCVFWFELPIVNTVISE